jgi:hypothetical protein
MLWTGYNFTSLIIEVKAEAKELITFALASAFCCFNEWQ